MFRSGWVCSGGVVVVEASPAGWTVGVDVVPEAVYHYVMVEPAQGGEVVRVMVPTGSPGLDVVYL